MDRRDSGVPVALFGRKVPPEGVCGEFRRYDDGCAGEERGQEAADEAVDCTDIRGD